MNILCKKLVPLAAFTKRSSSVLAKGDEKYANYESPIDYQALGEVLLGEEINSLRFSRDSNYRKEMKGFVAHYGGSKNWNAFFDEASTSEKSPEPKDVRRIEPRKASEETGHFELDPKKSAKFLKAWSTEKVAAIVHFPCVAASSGKSNKVKLHENSRFSLKNAVQREVFAKPWIAKYGNLPDSPFSIFSAELGIQRDFSHAYRKLMWEKLSPTEKRTYEKAYEFACGLKQKSREDVQSINRTFQEFFVDRLSSLVLQQCAFKILQPYKKFVNRFLEIDLKQQIAPKEFVELMQVVQHFEKRHAASAIKEICEARLSQIKQNTLSD